MTDTPTTTAPADIGPATAATLPALSQEAAATEIRVLRAGGDAAWREAYLGGHAHPGHAAAVMRMDHLHRLAAGVTADPAAPVSTTPGRDAAGRFTGEADAIDIAEYKDLNLRPAEGSSIEDMAAANMAARETAAVLRIPPDEARGHVALLEESIARRGGRAMEGGELDMMEAHLQRVAGPAYGEIVAGFKDAIARAGKHGAGLRNAILAADPPIAAMMIMNLGRKRA